MLFVIASWIIWSVGLASLGHLLILAFRRGTWPAGEEQVSVFQLVWLGVGVVVAIAQLASLVVALDGSVLIGVSVISLVGSPGLLRSLPSRLAVRRTTHFTNGSWILLLGGGTLLLVGVGAAGVATPLWSGAPDSDLYHFQVVRWANTYPAVPGLANLHNRLGLNSGFLLFSALLDNGCWDRHTAWLVFGFFVTLAAVQWFWIVLSRNDSESQPVRLFCLFTLPYLLKHLTTVRPTFYSDKPTLILQLVLAVELLRCIPRLFPTDGTASWQRHNYARGVAILLLVAALGFVFKPMGAASLALTSLLVLASAWRLRRQNSAAQHVWRDVLLAAVVPGLLLIGYLARNAVLSGWLLFPAPLGQLPVDWAMPRDATDLSSVTEMYRTIGAWARVPGPEYTRVLTEGFPFWFPRWYQRVWHGLPPLLFWVGSICFATSLGVALWRRRPAREMTCGAVLAVFAVVNLAAWFLTAPDLRFGDAFFWLWAALGASLLLSTAPLPGRVPLTVALAFFMFLCHALALDFTPRFRPTVFAIGIAAPRPTKTLVLNNGQTPPLSVLVPTEQDLCGDCELPSTPYPRNTLRLREPGDLRWGFCNAGAEPR